MKKIDFRKLNSITKYPSIYTYHAITGKGRLLPERVETSIFPDDETVNIYEKIDGENSRIVLIGDGVNIDYVIGSRKDLLLAKGDRIGVSTGNIARYFEPIADQLEKELIGFNGMMVLYFESYGGETPYTKNYSTDKTQFGRLFDMFVLSEKEVNELFDLDVRKFATWRDNGGQPYFTCEKRAEFAANHNLPTSPLLMTIKGSEIPVSVENTYEWMQQFLLTKVGINAEGISEGVIARSRDRKTITKIRFSEYKKTLNS